MGLSFNPNNADVLQSSVVTTIKAVSTTEVIAAASTSNAPRRQTIFIRNTSETTTVWLGESGFTAGAAGAGIPIYPTESIRLDINENISLYLRTEAGSINVVIWELG